MAVSIPQIKSAAALIKDHYNISESDSLRVIASYKADSVKIRAILAGDFSSVPGAAASVGVVLGDSLQDISPAASPEMIAGGAADGVNTSEKITAKRSRAAASDRVKASKDHTTIKHTDDINGGSMGLYKPVTDTKNNTDINGYNNTLGGSVSAQNDSICINDGVINNNAVTGLSDGLQDITQDDINMDCLPVGLVSDIETFIQDYCIQNEIDSKKIDPRQFKVICMVIGQDIIKRRKILRDSEREKKQGGIIYSPDKLNALLQVFAYICDKYKQPAFDFVFYRFAGVSREYFHDYCKRGLSSTSGQILKKARDLQTESIIQGIAAGGGSSVSYIFLGKALAGLQENTTITHVTAAAAPAVSALPVFDGSAGLLTDNTV